MVKLIATCCLILIATAVSAYGLLKGNGDAIDVFGVVAGSLALLYLFASVRGWVGSAGRMRRAFEEGRYGDAEEILRDAWDRGAEPVGNVAYSLSMALYHQGKVREALAIAEEGVERAPRYGDLAEVVEELRMELAGGDNDLSIHHAQP